MSHPVDHAESRHPGTGTYLAIAAVLFIITIVEVGVFYVPAFKPILAPALLALSAVKFSLVVMFYMHLKFDNPLFRVIFTLPLLLALGVAIALMFLFGAFGLRH
jgi:cytochrome c oxidase subunit 4